MPFFGCKRKANRFWLPKRKLKIGGKTYTRHQGYMGYCYPYDARKVAKAVVESSRKYKKFRIVHAKRGDAFYPYFR